VRNDVNGIMAGQALFDEVHEDWLHVLDPRDTARAQRLADTVARTAETDRLDEGALAAALASGEGLGADEARALAATIVARFHETVAARIGRLGFTPLEAAYVLGGYQRPRTLEALEREIRALDAAADDVPEIVVPLRRQAEEQIAILRAEGRPRMVPRHRTTRAQVRRDIEKHGF
jgi:hypothetical protein